MQPTEKIYLNEHYRELNLEGVIYQIRSEGDPVRFFIEAAPRFRQVLEASQMLEEQKLLPVEEPEVMPMPAPVEEKQSKEQPPSGLPAEWPDSFYCPSHKREHKQGSSAYALCLEKYGEEVATAAPKR